MISVLSGLECLALSHLLCLQLLLLLLVFLVPLGVAGIRSGRAFRRLDVPGVDCWRRAIIVDMSPNIVVRAACSGDYCAVVPESAGPGRGSDRRLAVIFGVA